MKFCTNNGCDNLLISFINLDKLMFKCNICNEEYESNPEDTLMIDQFLREGETMANYQNYLRNAHDDSIAELVYKKCQNRTCDETIVNVSKIDKNGQSTFICPKCRHKFV